jgi:hypothetical protein
VALGPALHPPALPRPSSLSLHGLWSALSLWCWHRQQRAHNAAPPLPCLLGSLLLCCRRILCAVLHNRDGGRRRCWLCKNDLKGCVSSLVCLCLPVCLR